MHPEPSAVNSLLLELFPKHSPQQGQLEGTLRAVAQLHSLWNAQSLDPLWCGCHALKTPFCSTCTVSCWVSPQFHSAISHKSQEKVIALNVKRDRCFTVVPKNILVSKSAEDTISFPRECNSSSSYTSEDFQEKTKGSQAAAPCTWTMIRRKSEQVLTTVRSRVMPLVVNVCNLPDSVWKMPSSAKLKGTTPGSSEEVKSTWVLQAPGNRDARIASNTPLTLVFVFPIALGPSPSASRIFDCESHCK